MSPIRRIAPAIATCALVLPIAAVASGPTDAASATAQAAAAPGPLDILITNDDGWRGDGGANTPLIVALRDALEAAGHDVTVAAPATDQSGQGGRFTIPPNRLTVANPEADVWTVSPGSPTDSVYFAMGEIFADTRPDLVISGINPGNNSGPSVNHSGTFNGASAATEFGVPAIAVSLATKSAWPEGVVEAAPGAAQYTAELVRRLQKDARSGPLMPQGAMVNVNLPLIPGPIDPATGKPGSVLPPKGEKLTTIAEIQEYEVDYSNSTGGAGQPGTYAIGFAPTSATAPKGTDIRAVHDGYVSLTPLELDRDVDASTTAWLRALL